MIKVGDRVYIVPADTRHAKHYAKVIKIGRKYVTTDGHPDYNKFDIATHYSADTPNGWNARCTFYESEEQYLFLENKKLEIYKLKEIIAKKINTKSLSDLQSINNYIDSL